jgi:hypothetical protein
MSAESIVRSLSYEWTEEDRLTCARWRRGMAVFYGCMALFVFGFIMLTRPSSVATNEARDGQTWSAGLQGERMDRNAQMSEKAR